MKTIIFDLDGTLAESKQPIDAEMALLLSELLTLCSVAVISGGSYEQFQKQIVVHLPPESVFKNLLLLPVTGTSIYRFIDGAWKELYADMLSPEEKTTITRALVRAEQQAGIEHVQSYGEKIEDRRTQITYSGLGQDAPVSAKKDWDPQQIKRKRMMIILGQDLPDFDIHCGGMTSIDITRKGVDKASGIHAIQKITGTAIIDMTFIGDALFPGGNDFPATTTGVNCIAVHSVEETKQAIKKIIEVEGD